jgi:multiple sugar transport system substrate-binding protein
MIEIEFSTIPDSQQESDTLTSLMDEFRQKHQVNVRIRNMTWGTAWSELMSIASHGRGADVSHIGSTWLSSLVLMNSVRAFSPADISNMGGAQSFVSPAWQGGIVEGDTRLWSAPWTSYFYVIVYRRDLLRKLDIEENAAFSTNETIGKTVATLKTCDIEYPWLMPIILAPHTDYLHVGASFIWGAGGDFLSKDTTRSVFNQNKAVEGLKDYLKIERASAPAPMAMGNFECMDAFLDGKAGAIIIDARLAKQLLISASDGLKPNIGISAISNVPWFGGGSLMIWRHVQGYPERERAAINLVNFLLGKEAQLKWQSNTTSLPSRLEAVNSAFPEGHPLLPTFENVSKNGRPYRSVALWHRIEYQLSMAMGDMVKQARSDRNADLDKIVRDHVEPLAARLDLTLGN